MARESRVVPVKIGTTIVQVRVEDLWASGGRGCFFPQAGKTRFPALFCTLRFGGNPLQVLAFDVQARCGWLRVAASKRCRGVPPCHPETISCTRNTGKV
jgi:hypothetical protein